MANQLAFYFNQSACTGCKACQLACKDDNDLDEGILWRRVVEIQGGGWTQSGSAWIQNLTVYHLSMACNHCEEPICEEVCPTQAITKRDDGIVLIDEDKCIGCGYCHWVCPYAAPQYQADKGKMTKCDFCYEYVDAGLEPACVAACPMRALEFGELSELQAQHGNISTIYPMSDPSLTKPAIVITPHRTAAPGQMDGLEIANMEEI